MENDFRKRIDEHPVLWVLGLLTVGFLAGAGFILAANSYSGVHVMTITQHEALEKERSGLRQTVEELQKQQFATTVAIAKTQKDAEACEVREKEQSTQHKEVLEFRKKQKESDAELGRLKRQVSALQRNERELNTKLKGEQAKYKAVLSPKSTQSKALIRKTVYSENSLVSYLDDALTSNLVRVSSSGWACISTNFHKECQKLYVGEYIHVTVGGKKYGLRLDETNYGYDKATISLFLFR